MADSRKTVQIKSDPVGDVRIADEVVAIIAGLAAVVLYLVFGFVL